MEAYVLMPGDGRRIDLGNFAMVVKAGPEQTSGAFTLLQAEEPPGFGPPMHIHHDTAEAFYVVSGEYLVYIDEAEHVCAAGSFIFIPAGVRHGFRVGSQPSSKLNLYTPAAMIRYFEALSAAIAAGAGEDELASIARANSMEITGPVPEGYV